MVLTTGRQGPETPYRAIVDRALRSATGDVLDETQADFAGYY